MMKDIYVDFDKFKKRIIKKCKAKSLDSNRLSKLSDSNDYNQLFSILGGDYWFNYYGILEDLTTLPDNLSVGSHLWLDFTNITSLPDNLSVRNSLDLRYTKIKTLPKSLKVGCRIYNNNHDLTDQELNELRNARTNNKRDSKIDIYCDDGIGLCIRDLESVINGIQLHYTCK